MNYCPPSIGPSQIWTCKPSRTRRKCCQHKKPKSSLTYEQLHNMKYNMNKMPQGNHKACLPSNRSTQNPFWYSPLSHGTKTTTTISFLQTHDSKRAPKFHRRGPKNKNTQNKVSFCGEKKMKRKTKATMKSWDFINSHIKK